jgi:hypothetical protein
MKTKYTRLDDGDGFEIDPNNILYFACCDCGLVHRIEFKKINRLVKMKMFRENRRTAAYRREHGIIVK